MDEGREFRWKKEDHEFLGEILSKEIRNLGVFYVRRKMDDGRDFDV